MLVTTDIKSLVAEKSSLARALLFLCHKLYCTSGSGPVVSISKTSPLTSGVGGAIPLRSTRKNHAAAWFFRFKKTRPQGLGSIAFPCREVINDFHEYYGKRDGEHKAHKSANPTSH